MDPLGRYVLARAEAGDSAWVIAVGTARVVGSVNTSWRDDLPMVAADGAILLASGTTVRIVDGETLRERSSVDGGAADFWYAILWNGFRPRAGVLDQPVTFADSDSVAVPADSGDTSAVAPAPGDTAGRAPRAPIPRPTPPRIPTDTARAAPSEPARPSGWTVSFAAYLSEASARARAASITVDGQRARVVAGQTPGTTTTVYRVVLGPYPTKADAERVGRESRESFWVYEGNP
jgi:cell division septation protein DedD